MKNSLCTKVEETAWFSSDSVSSVTPINLIAAKNESPAMALAATAMGEDQGTNTSARSGH